jgi:2-polyprenyl-6-methoxyphenol hydroxylase-like FAD-dependent oxidoreductase
LFEVDEDAFWGMDDRPRCVMRSALAALLREGLPASALALDTRVEDIRTDDTSVTVTTADTAGGAGTGAVRGRIVIGADGVHSRVRTLAFPDVRLRAALLSPWSWRFMAPDPGVDCWTVWAGPGAMFLLIPLGNGDVYGWASINDLAAHRKHGLRGMFRDFPAEVRRTGEFLAAQAGSLYHSPLEEVRPTVCGERSASS